MRRSVLVLSCAAALSCQQDQEAARINGTYGGTLQGSQGVATVTIQFGEAEGALQGTAHGTGLTFVGGQTYYVVGTHTDGDVDFTISGGFETPNQSLIIIGDCKYLLSGHLNSSRLQGTYTTPVCPRPDAGTFDLQRQ